MTPAEHAELSAQVARAIGWKYVATDINPPVYHVYVSNDAGECGWFDYRDPTVWGPLLKWLFEKHSGEMFMYNEMFVVVDTIEGMTCATTLEEAIAHPVGSCHFQSQRATATSCNACICSALQKLVARIPRRRHQPIWRLS